MKKIYFAEGFLAAKETELDKGPKHSFLRRMFKELFLLVLLLSITGFVMYKITGASGSLLR